MKGFYSEMIQEINEMIEKGEEASALNKIEEELSMPYHSFGFSTSDFSFEAETAAKDENTKADR